MAKSSTNIKRIGVMTSGGDCPGLNAAIRAVVRTAILKYGWEVMGVLGAMEGLAARPLACKNLTLHDVGHEIMCHGGTMLGTNSGLNDPFTGDGGKNITKDIVEGFRLAGLDAVIGIGGESSFAHFTKLAKEHGLKFVGIPKTIDNDVAATETSIGFNTAVETVVGALDRLQTTAESHSRVMVVEVMGYEAGHIALHAGIAGGADVILIPEIEWSKEALCSNVKAAVSGEKKHAVVVVSEAIPTLTGEKFKTKTTDIKTVYKGGTGSYVANLIEGALGITTRSTVLGHVQRGGTPNYRDRIVASALGAGAVDLVAQGKFGRMVGWTAGKITDAPFEDAISHYNNVDVGGSLVKTALNLGIYLGEV